MDSPESCLVLRKADGQGLIVTADFAATGRTTATFHDLVDLLRADHTIWETAPVPYGQEPGMSGADQVERWTRDIRDSGLPVHAVIGFCGGGVYAGKLAEQIGQWQPVPRLILLDPGRPTALMLGQHVEGLLRRLAGTFVAADLEAAQARLAAIRQSTPEPLTLAEELAGYGRDVLVAALQRAFHSPQASSDFVNLVTGYLYWLGGAATLDPRASWKSASALQSSSQNFGLFLASPEERQTLVGHATYVDVPHADLMRTPAVARAVDDLLN